MPEHWATADTIQDFDANVVAEAVAPGATFLAMDEAADSVLVGSSESSAAVFSVSAGKVIHTLQLGNGSALAGTWWGGRAIVATSAGAIKVFEGENELTSLSKHAGAATSVALHPCGDVLVSIGVDKSFVLYDLQELAPLMQQYLNTGEEQLCTMYGVRVLTVPDLSSAAFHPDGHLLAIGTTSGEIKLFDVKTLENIHNFPPSAPAAINGLSFSENGTWLAASSEGHSEVSIWNLRKTELLKTIDMGGPIRSIAWDYTGQFLAACGPSCVAIQYYSKSSKAWSEPFRKATSASFLGWGANGQKLVTVTSEGSVVIFAAES